MHRFPPEAPVILAACRGELDTHLLNVVVDTSRCGQRAISLVEHISPVTAYIGAGSIRIKLAEHLHCMSVRHRRAIHLGVIGGLQDMAINTKEKLGVLSWRIAEGNRGPGCFRDNSQDRQWKSIHLLSLE